MTDFYKSYSRIGGSQTRTSEFFMAVPVSRDILSPHKTIRGDELVYPPRMELAGIEYPP